MIQTDGARAAVCHNPMQRRAERDISRAAGLYERLKHVGLDGSGEGRIFVLLHDPPESPALCRPQSASRRTPPRRPSACGASRTDRRAGRPARPRSRRMGQRHLGDFRGKLVRSAAQSRKVDRKPCTVDRRAPSGAALSCIVLGVRRPRLPGKDEIVGPDLVHLLEQRQRGRGQRNAVLPPAFIRSAGIVQTFAARSISSQVAPSTSPVLAAVRMANSSARAPMLLSLAQRGHEGADLGVRQRRVVLDWRTCVAPATDDPGVRATAPGSRRSDSRAPWPNRAPPRSGPHPRRRLWVRLPDRLDRLHHQPGVDRCYRQLAQCGVDMLRQRVRPLLLMRWRCAIRLRAWRYRRPHIA